MWTKMSAHSNQLNMTSDDYHPTTAIDTEWKLGCGDSIHSYFVYQFST